MAKFKDYYDVLGVSPRSHARIIEETYWDRAHELHAVPTRKAQQRLAVLNEAYETLGTPYKRAAYDRRWHQEKFESDQSNRGGGFLHAFVSVLGKAFRPD